MCGICGVISLEGPRPGLGQLAARMAELLVHRGPDDFGAFETADVALAMRRLSIIDLDGGHQPIANETGDVHVVCNGEIYNYVELREELQSRGHKLRTRGDVETIVHLYEEYGLSFPSKLNGMFAIALVDEVQRRVVLVRDRIGKKPLFVARGKGLLGFSSEIKPLLLLPNLHPRVRLDALNALLRYNYVPRPLTLFDGIEEVEAGGILVIERGQASTTRYWDIRTRVDADPAPVDEAMALERLEGLIVDSVSIRLRSDVPVGLFLSGGVDSSVVGAGMRRSQPNGSFDSFSVSFTDTAYDETQWARAAASRFEFSHHRIDLALQPDQALLDDVMWHLEEPHGDASFVATYLLARAASPRVKVVLTGDGGDELFGGYVRYQQAWRAAANGEPGRAFESALMETRYLSDGDRAELLAPDARAELPPAESLSIDTRWLPPRTSPEQTVRALMALDIHALLTDNNVVKPDKMAMAWSLEARCPLLDYRLAECAINLHGALHVDGSGTKRLLGALAARWCAPLSFDRPKQQFTVPVGEWIRNDRSGVYSDLLNAASGRPWFDGAVVRRWHREHRDGSVNRTRELRLLAAIETWARLFLDKPLVSRRPSVLAAAGSGLRSL